MGKKLAIKGHSTRGKEIIELLEMMGGEAIGAKGYDEHAIYVIPENGIIDVRFAYQKHIDNYAIFTLEDFLEKFPYKVGDKVHIYVQNDDIDGRYDIEVAEITSMRWNPARCKIAYKMKNINREFYKEEIKCKVDDSDDVHSIFECKTIGQGTYAIKIADGYKFDGIDENGNIIAKSIKPKYPKTYEECVRITKNIHGYDINIDAPAYRELLESFVKLLICRDAYWKIAGEELGLGEPWKPDLENEELYCIQNYNKQITISRTNTAFNKILIFPTGEMRDAFYDNFKDLIEQCKEWL